MTINIKRELKPFLEICCTGFQTTAQKVLNHLLSKNDIQDIEEGSISARTMKAHIKIWIDQGKKKIN